MRLLLIIAGLVFAMPITGFGWAEGSNLLLDPHLICKKPKRLRGKLYEICKNETSLWKEISNGIQLGFQECQHQFKNRRWNCTTQKKYMRKILVKDTRETGFVNAITAAGITYAVTRACTKGDLFECSCDKNHRRNHISQQHNNKIYNTNNNNYKNSNYNNRNIKDNNSDNNNNNNNNVNDNNIISSQYNSNNNNNNNHRGYRNRNNHMKKHRIKQHNKMKSNRKLGKNIVPPTGDNWEWGGCDDNINFGYRKSKDFLDARYKRRSDIKTLVKLHNNDAGRLAVKNNMGVVCKCHGLTGSCTIKTCWIKMSEFREIGQRLKERFDGASKVIARNDGYSFMPEGPTLKHPTKHDLVYTEDSPDFCKLNYKTGSMGTHGRECNATSQGVDGCDLLCCSRGYDNKVVRDRVNCHCVLKINFKVACSTCIEKREVNTCK